MKNRNQTQKIIPFFILSSLCIISVTYSYECSDALGKGSSERNQETVSIIRKKLFENPPQRLTKEETKTLYQFDSTKSDRITFYQKNKKLESYIQERSSKDKGDDIAFALDIKADKIYILEDRREPYMSGKLTAGFKFNYKNKVAS